MTGRRCWTLSLVASPYPDPQKDHNSLPKFTDNTASLEKGFGSIKRCLYYHKMLSHFKNLLQAADQMSGIRQRGFLAENFSNPK